MAKWQPRKGDVSPRKEIEPEIDEWEDKDWWDEQNHLPEGYGAMRVYECSCDTNYICGKCRSKM